MVEFIINPSGHVRSMIEKHTFRHVDQADYQKRTPSFYADTIAAIYGEDQGRCIAAVDGESLAGYILSVTRQSQRGEILAFFVAPESRRRGIGTTILNTMISDMKLAGCFCISVDVAPANRTAIAVYSSAGFSAATLQLELTTTNA